MNAESGMTPEASRFSATDGLCWLLATFLFFLPTSRVIGNACAGLFLLILVYWSAKRRLRIDAYTVAWFAYIVVALASGLSNYPYPDFRKGITDTLECTVVALVFYHAPVMTRVHTDRFFRAIIFGVVLASVLGFIRLVGDPVTYPRLQLPAGGSVTQSSIIVGIAIIGCLRLSPVLVRAGAAGLSSIARHFIVLCVMVLFAGTMAIMGARGSILGTLVALGTILLLTLRAVTRPQWYMIVGAVVAALVVGALAPKEWTLNADFAGKFARQWQSGRLDSNDRLRVLSQKYGWYLYRTEHKPLLGVGPRNFGQAGHNVVPAEILRDMPEFQIPTHPHNFILTKLAEEGIAGVLALGWILAHVGVRIWRDRRSVPLTTDWSWGLAVAAWMVPVVSCSFNAPWFQEHAMLCAAIFSIYLRRRLVLSAAPSFSTTKDAACAT